jgi:hypothetical protein
MELLESYLKAVKRYLPRGQREDIAAELSEELRSQIEAREAEFGRPLRETEQMDLFKAHGDPMVVARRYPQGGMSLRIGGELIGPEMFPMYLIILGLNTSFAVAVTIAILLYLHQPISAVALLRTAIMQVMCVTFIFTILNLVRRKFPQPWYYPPAALAPMIPIPRWVSVSGLVIWCTFTLWWAAIPAAPRLLLGSAAGYLELAPSWHRFYLPLLALLVAGIAQRAVNLVRPSWTALLPASRVLINAIALGLQYPMLKSYPYIVVAAARNSSHANSVAANFNLGIFWGILSWMWTFHLIAAVIYAWYCAPHLRRLLDQLSSGPDLTHELKGIL